MLDRFKLPYQKDVGQDHPPFGRCCTWSEWQEQRRWQRENYPVRFFIWNTAPRWFRVKKMRLNDIYYKVRSWFLPFNVIKIKTLPATYQEPFDVLLHGSFQVLIDFVEQEQIPWVEAWTGKKNLRAEDAFRTTLEEYTDDYDEDHELFEGELESLKAQAHREAEILDLYNWWKYERPLREKAAEDLHGERPAYDGIDSLSVLDLDEDHPAKKDFRSYGQKLMRAEEFGQKEDELQLIRLAKIRLHLWS